MNWKMAAAVAGMVWLCALPAKANFLDNPGFETGNFSGWTVDGSQTNSFGVGPTGQIISGTNIADFGTAVVDSHSGTFAAFGAIASGQAVLFTPPQTPLVYGAGNQLLRLSQTIDLGAGIYSAGFFITIGSGHSTFGNFSQILLDGVALRFTNGSFGADFIQGNGVFTEDTTSFSVATGGLHTIEFDISGSGTAAAGISADDFFVNAVPEPPTLAIFFVGLIGLGVISRRYH
jgi:hypothetical protein